MYGHTQLNPFYLLEMPTYSAFALYDFKKLLSSLGFIKITYWVPYPFMTKITIFMIMTQNPATWAVGSMIVMNVYADL